MTKRHSHPALIGRRGLHTPILRFAAAVIAFFAGVLLSSCFNPLNKLVLDHVKDLNAPHISITSPANDSSYAATVVVSGTVSDTAAGGSTGQVKSLSYQVLATSLKGNVTIGKDGSFSFQFPTTGLSGSLTVQMSATDWNGNLGTKSLLLVNNGAIPSFTATPGNHQVTLTWGPTALATTYTLFYTTNGTMPSASYGIRIDNVTSPYTVSGLEDGQLHEFLLRANSSAGLDNYSTVQAAIPLSPLSLVPQIDESTRAVQLTWNPIPATNDFTVWRATSENGPYTNITGDIHNTHFTDNLMLSDETYWYKVEPASYGQLNTTAAAGQEWPYSFSTEHALLNANCHVGSYPVAVAVNGSNAVVGESSGAIEIYDVADPSCPKLLDALNYGGLPKDVVIRGSYAYIADARNGLVIVDLSNPQSLSESGSTKTEGYPESVVLSPTSSATTYAYVADSSGLRVINVSDPTNPVEGTSINVTNTGAIATDGSNLYLTNGNQLLAYGLSDPANPILAGTLTTTSDSFVAVAVSGHYAYLADSSFGLRVVDLSNPSSMSVVGSYSSVGSATSIAIDGDYVLLTTGAVDLEFIDVADPTAPFDMGSVSLGDTYPYQVTTSDSVAYVADGDGGIALYDASNPTNPMELTPPGPTTGFGSLVAVQGNLAIVGNGSAGLQLVDVSDPVSPQILKNYNPGNGVYALAQNGNYTFTGDGAGGVGMRVIDLSNPSTPVPVGSVSFAGYRAYEISLSGAYAYVATGLGGTQIVDVSDPTAPTVISSIAPVYQATSVTIHGSYAFVGDALSKMQITDISNPHSPRPISVVSTAGAPTDISVAGTYAVVSESTSIEVFDISDVTAPQLVGSLTTAGNALSVAVRGSYAFVADDTDGLRVVDLSDPQYPIEAGYIDTAGSARKITVIGSRAYLADGSDGLRVYSLGAHR